MSLLPAHIHPNPDPDPNDPEAKIPPLPESFLRYDNNWRAALRNFQSDLESGRYRPDWQRQAKQAVHERAQGKFDDFKEQEFEQFWGQKQKINHGLIAGESSKVKLETLIAHDVVRVGDVWKYCRVFGAKKAQVVVEKEVKITAIDGGKLSFLMPTGQRVFLGAVDQSKTKDEVANDTQMDINPVPTSQSIEDPPTQVLDEPAQIESSTQYNLRGLLEYALQPDLEVKPHTEKDEIECKEATSAIEQPAVPQSPGSRRKRGRPVKRKSSHDKPQNATADVNIITDIEADAPQEVAEESTNIAENGVNLDPVPESAPEQDLKDADSSQQSTTPTVTNIPATALSLKAESETKPCTAPTTPLEVEIHNIAGPSALTKKILETDGRVPNPPNGNAWKEIRCYRNNQDMGSLWEVRQAWYVKYQQS